MVLKESGIFIDCSFIDGNDLFIFKELKSLKRLKNRIEVSKTPIYDDIRSWAKKCLGSRKDLKTIARFVGSGKL